MTLPTPVVQVSDLHLAFTGARSAHALNGVSFEVRPGEVLGLLGESGSGKSVTLRALLRLHPEARTRVSGRMFVDGQDVLALRGRGLQRYRGGTVSMVFQEPGLAFDPVYSVGAQIAEAVRAHEPVDRAIARHRTLQMLDRVQIPQARRRYDAYPHELSGGMRQRAMIALALACRPKLLLADEPTTALDATVQIQILLLLRELQRETGMAVIFVTHDIGAAVEVSDRLAVMYAGRIVEQGPAERVVKAPRHPYSAGLLGASVNAAPRGRPLPAIPGAPPDLAVPVAGCPFAPRCGRAQRACSVQPPAFDDGPGVACWAPLQPLSLSA
ncbi:ABC transporter ATP-binding protein [Ramlibacter monticola]|uniref:ABC transporter ATP-binding protein n=1 Tax=Ramlibacter monticola TaxID=1926872 RepID=A0A936Z2E0_9BURK|nr:ABC transporter ATP-binding protein [Ramlibacter monticola]MBL0392485.1 ABC transporter ATP-binding protein [Ramlibacter monticola]